MFLYPEQSSFGKVLPKSKIYKHARVTRRVQKCFIDQVSRIVWQYKLSPGTTNLPARAGVPEIQVFTIALKTETLDENVLRCIDKAISFPIIYELNFQDRIKVVAAYKRPNEADAVKWIVGDYYETAWQPVDTERSLLPVSLDLAGLYEQLLRKLMPLPARNGESLKTHAERLAMIRSKERECDTLQARLNKEKQFNRKVELNAVLRAIKQELESLID